MKYGLVWIISSFSLSGIVPFKWSSPTSLMTFFLSALRLLLVLP